MGVPERLAGLAHRAGRWRVGMMLSLARDPPRAVESRRVMGLAFSSPLGMAAGFDRYGTMAHRAHRIGLGFVETGTVMPRPEPGGNLGIEVLLRNLERRGWSYANVREGRARLGISIGRNSATPASESWRDFVDCMRRGVLLADYFTLNLGTLIPELVRDHSLLWSLLSHVKACQLALEFEYRRRVPIVVKLQLNAATLEGTLRCAEGVASAGCDGILAVCCDSGEEGPVTGDKLLIRLARRVGNRVNLVSVGGVNTVEEFRKRLRAGASLVQVHRALLTSGPARIRAISRA